MLLSKKKPVEYLLDARCACLKRKSSYQMLYVRARACFFVCFYVNEFYSCAEKRRLKAELYFTHATHVHRRHLSPLYESPPCGFCAAKNKSLQRVTPSKQHTISYKTEKRKAKTTALIGGRRQPNIRGKCDLSPSPTCQGVWVGFRHRDDTQSGRRQTQSLPKQGLQNFPPFFWWAG